MMDQHAIDKQIEKTLNSIKDFIYDDGDSERWNSDKDTLKAIITDHTLIMTSCDHEWFQELSKEADATSNANTKKWR